MSWSTTKPSGVSWSSEVTSAANSANNYNYFRVTAAVARGANNTIYVRAKIQLNGKTYGQDGNTQIRAEVSVNGAAWEKSSTYDLQGEYGGWLTKKTVYYTGTAAPGVSIRVRTAWSTSNYSGQASFTAPAYTTTFTITYYGNGATSGSVAAQSKLYDSAITLQSNGFTRTGYTFSKWNTAANGTGTSYNAGASYTANADASLYAIWNINTWTVSYNANGGSGAPAAQTKTYGVTLTLSTTVPTRTGYTFLGWSTSNTATTATYAAGGSYTANAAATLYAVWKLITYTITYKANGGTGSDQTQTKNYGTAVTLKAASTFTRTNYTFVSWNTKADGTGTTYNAGASYATNAALTLYAIWKKNNIPVFINVSGTIKQAEKAYINVNGTVKEATMYIRIGSTIYELV